ncbi:MAG: DUF2125 domain-containing protein, partial [Aestuariivirga sp.]
MASSTKRPWHMFYPLAGMILISIVWCGYWFVAFQATQELVAAKRLELAGKGAQLICAQENWGGFPFRFEFWCQDPSLRFSGAGNTYQLKSAKLLVVAQAYNPLHILLLVDGPTTFDLGTAVLQTVSHDQALISVKLNTNGEFDISSEAAKVDAPDVFSASQLRVFARRTNTTLDLAANAQQLVVRGPQDSPVSIAAAEFLANANAAFLEQPFAAPNAEKPLDIHSLKISLDAADLSAQGDIFLDAQHRLAGKLSSETTDIDRLLQVISPILGMNEKDRAAIKELVRPRASDPATKAAKADFIAGDGALFWGAFKLADLE